MFAIFRSLDVMNDVCEMFRSLNSTNGVVNVDSMNGAMRIFRDRTVGKNITREGLETAQNRSSKKHTTQNYSSYFCSWAPEMTNGNGPRDPQIFLEQPGAEPPEGF